MSLSYFKLLPFIFLFSSSFSYSIEYSADFKNANIEDFVSVVGGNLRKTIILDPSVQGTVNVKSAQKLNPKQYFQFFLNVLSVYGYSVVNMDNNIIKVVASGNALKNGISFYKDGSDYAEDQLITRLITLKNVSSSDLSSLLKNLIDTNGGGGVVNYGPSNLIMLTGRVSIINSLVDIITEVDLSTSNGFDFIKLKNSDALDIISLLSKVSSDVSSTSDASGITAFNSNNIDSASSGSKFSAFDVNSSSYYPKFVADERTNSIIISGEKNARLRMIDLIHSLDVNAINLSGNTNIFYLQYALAEQVESVLKTFAANSSSPVSIDSDSGTNSVIVSARPAVMSSLSNIVNKLDIRRAQVLVEAIIVEVSDTDGFSISSQFATSAGGSSFSNNEVTSSNVGSTYVNDTTSSLDFLSSATGGLLGFINTDWAFIFKAIKTNSSSNILSTPSLLTLDNQSASFIVGDEVPVIMGTSTSDDGSTSNNVERQEVGIKLNVTPHINKGDTVRMTVNQEVSSVQGSTDVDVIFAKRSINTTVLSRSGETVVLGGLISNDVVKSIDKIPLLGDIPWIGALFRSEIETVKKTNLMIFLRATIIKNNDFLGELSHKKYQSLESISEGFITNSDTNIFDNLR